MPKPEFPEAWKIASTIGLTLVLGVTMNYIGTFDALGQFGIVFAFIGGLFLSLAIIQVGWWAVPKTLEAIRTPNSKNIRLISLPLTNNEIRLKINNSEFRKHQVIISGVEIGIKGQENWLSVSHNNSTLKFFKAVEIPFVKLHPADNAFSVIYPDHEDLKRFGYGLYEFDVVISYGYLSSREGKLSRYVIALEYNRDTIKVKSVTRAT